MTASAASMASMTPGAGSASDAPAKRTEFTGSWYQRCTKYSSKLNSPTGVSMRVSTRESLMGRTRALTPSFSEITAVASESVLPSASRRERSKMHGQVAVASVKPCGLAELPHGLQAEERVAFHAPSTFAAQHAGEHEVMESMSGKRKAPTRAGHRRC